MAVSVGHTALRNHSVMMFEYNLWATQRCIKALRGMPEAAAAVTPGLVFDTPVGIMNHIALAEALWYGRVTGAEEVRGRSMSELGALWQSPSSTWTGAVKGGLDGTAQELEATTHLWLSFVDSVLDERLTDSFAYTDTGGESKQAVLHHVLAHLVNHSTHHRGQVTCAILNETGEAVGLDLTTFLAERPDA